MINLYLCLDLLLDKDSEFILAPDLSVIPRTKSLHKCEYKYFMVLFPVVVIVTSEKSEIIHAGTTK